MRFIIDAVAAGCINRALMTNNMDQSLKAIRAALGKIPDTLIVAGSGLGGFAQTLADSKSIGYADIPGFPVSSVAGHAGTLVKGKCGKKAVLVLNGRKHLYEGVEATTAVYPLQTLLRGGIKTVILSNAAGGLDMKFAVGDLMLITDHIAWQFRNPLIGPNDAALGPRFPDMSNAYDKGLQKLARETAHDLGLTLREGVYWANMGPTYETQAEVQMLRQFANAVGMSTAPETIAAVHAGARVLGISLISNSLVHRSDAVTTHTEVMEAGRIAGETFTKLVTGLVGRLK